MMKLFCNTKYPAPIHGAAYVLACCGVVPSLGFFVFVVNTGIE